MTLATYVKPYVNPLSLLPNHSHIHIHFYGLSLGFEVIYKEE